MYLEVNKVEPPLRGVCVGVVRHKQGILEAGEGLAVVGILCGCVDAPAPDESCGRTVGLQVHGLQGEPVPCGRRIKPLTHGKTADQTEERR